MKTGIAIDGVSWGIRLGVLFNGRHLDSARVSRDFSAP